MAIKALYQTGLVYEDFSEALFNAPVPKGLDQEAMDIYRMQLEEQAFPLEEKAADAYERALRKAHELKIYGEDTQRILTALNQLKPTKYPLVYEKLPVFGHETRSWVVLQ